MTTEEDLNMTTTHTSACTSDTLLVTTHVLSSGRWEWCGDDATVGTDEVPTTPEGCTAAAVDAWDTYIQQWELEAWRDDTPGGTAYRLLAECAEHHGACDKRYCTELKIERDPETGEPIGVTVCGY
jgi:hypothetical protein